jgi:cytochrome c
MRPTFFTLALFLAAALPAAAQDLEKGEKVFKKCAACHQVGPEAENRVGPVLNGIVGAAAGQAADFKYSDAMLSSGLTWDEATLAAYLKAPKEVVPGTKMSFAGLKKDEEIADVIAYLATFPATAE